ncbi:MAG: hypothetical protein FJX46_17935, partial [Alphaproteobacteria bacterium]|nr:hypothetical protein [Alphaproteobacteria bacterium]
DEATWSLFTAIGLGRSALLPKARGMAAVRQAIAYHREVSVGQSLIALSGVLHLGRTSLRFFHRMIQQEDSAVVAETVLTAVHLDLTTRRPTPFADEVRAGAEAWIRLAPDGFALPTGE